MRTLKQLYTILYDRITSEPSYIGNLGLCLEMLELHRAGLITSEEFNVLNCNFLFQKPSEYKYQSFYNHPCFNGYHFHWWSSKITAKTPTDLQSGWDQRRLFIRHLITTL